MKKEERICRNCPSFIPTDKVRDVFGKSIGAPMCKRFGKVLGGASMLDEAADAIQVEAAASCTFFGHPDPKMPQGWLDTQVALPHPVVSKELAFEPSSDADLAMVATCLSCKFYVQEKTVIDEWGWNSGLCSAQGRLIIPGRQSKEASTCTTAKPGSYSPSVMGGLGNITLREPYKSALEYDPSALGAYKKGVIDPNEYVTDAELDDEDLKFGIRAWREVKDPNGSGNTIMLPIFDPNSFPESQRALIPQTGDAEHPEAYIDAEDYVFSVAAEWMGLDATPALWGPPGVGKTELGRHLAWLMQAPFVRFTFTRDMEVEDIIGKMVFLDGETKFQQGRLPIAWQRPGVMLFDEPNTAPDSVWQRIRPITDNSKQLVLDEGNAEIVRRHPFCFLLMAMNPAHDTRNIGVNELADADVDRLTHISMKLPSREVEEQILLDACENNGWTPTSEQIKGVLDNSEEIRALVKDGSLPVSWGVRPNLKVILHLQFFKPEVAYRRAITDMLEDEVAEMILRIVTTGGRL